MYQERQRTLLASSLYDGIENGNLRHVMTILHEKKGDPNAILPSKGISPFHLAVGCDNELFAEDVTKLLLQFGGHPNTRSLDGMTPVHIAAAWGRTNLLHLLLLNGGDPWLLDEEGNDAFDYAYQGEYSDSVELLNRFMKLDAKSPNQADVIPKFKVTLDKVMLYNRNAILEYKTDTHFAPTQSRQLKCATTQTTPRESGLEYDGVSDVGKYTRNRANDSYKMATELPEKFNSVLADLKDNNVTLRRGKRKKHVSVNVFEEKEFPTQPEKSHVSGKSLYDELKAVTFVEEKKEDPKKTCSLLHGSQRSLKCEVKEWQLKSIKKTEKSPSVSEMTLIDELKKWQANSIKLAKPMDSTIKNVDDRKEIVRTADSKHTLKQTDNVCDKSFIEELKEWQADGFKNLKKPNSSTSHENPRNWMEELKERQADGLRDNIKQLSLEASKTQLVTSEVMVRVNPVPLEDDQESVHKIPSDLVQEDLVVVDPNQPSEITSIKEPVLRTQSESMLDLANETVDEAIESVSLLIEEDAGQPCKLHIPFEKLYGFTLEDGETFRKDMLSDSDDAKESTTPEENDSPLRDLSARSCELHRLLPDNANEAVMGVLHVVDVPVPVSEMANHFLEASHEDVSDLKEVLVTAANPDVEQVEESAMPAVDCTTIPALVWEELTGDSLSECEIQNDNDFMLSSSHQITKEPDEYIDITDSPPLKSIVVNAQIQSKNEIEGSMNKIINILPSEATFRRHLVNLSNNEAMGTKKQFLDLDDWITMDWMDHDEPLPNRGLRFTDDDLFDNSDDDMPQILSLEQDKSVLTENTSKSVRSSPDYFTCSEEIQTLARYPGGKPKVPKVSHFQNMTVTSLPNMSQMNCDNSLSVGMLQPTISEGQFLAKTKSYQQISIQPLTSTQVQDTTTTSSLSDTDSFVSVSEDYIYTDEEEGVVLLERRYLVPEPNLSSSDQGASLNSSSVGSGSYDTDTLRSELKRRGLDPGPIIPSTKRVYVKRLRRLARNPGTLPENKPVYSPELERTLRTENWHLDVSTYESLEREVALQFAEPDTTRHWRQGIIKSSFCYLLLDPRVTCNLPCRTDTTPRPKIWSSFLEAIFYVGKGKRSRPYSHLYQAVSVWKTGATSSDNKIQHILDIWRDGVGVVCLHIFQNTIPVEAYTREAAMIDALKLCNLRNARLSEYYGVAATWPSHKKRLLGVYLLYKAMLIFLNEGERQLRPADIGH